MTGGAGRDRARDAILGALVADAASTGLHWIYDVEEVRKRGGEEPEFHPLGDNRYHGRRVAGDFTHYGDHALVMLESLVARGRLEPDDYRRRYVERFGAPDYDGYLDHATRDLLQSGEGSDDNQAGCFTKLPALVARYLEDPEFDARIETAIRVTHENVQAVRYGLAAADAIRAAVRGSRAEEAVAAAARRPDASAALAERALESKADDHTAFALAVGQTCPVPNAFPVALHAALKGGDFRECVRLSILAGGDTAGRLCVTGAIRGATDGVPPEWLARLTQRARVEELAERLLAEA